MGASLTHGEDFLTGTFPGNHEKYDSSKSGELLTELTSHQDSISSTQLDQLNLKGASCHNSFVSNLTLDQAYGFANVFSDTTLELYRCDKPTGRMAKVKFIYPELGSVEADSVKDRLRLLAETMVKPENGRLYRTIANRIWERLMGRGIVEPLDEMDNTPWSATWEGVKDYGSDYQKESLMRSMEQSYRLLNSPEAKAFDLSQEPKEVYDLYNTGRFGLGCLMARRLAMQGARFISVSTEYEPFLGWDTHENGHTRLVKMKQLNDRPIAQLIKDLDETGHLDRTLIILASEFSRDAILEGRPGEKVKDQVNQQDVIEDEKFYGMHRHFTDRSSILLWGGGIQKGLVYGKKTDERPCSSIEKTVVIDQVHQSIYHALGIPPETHYTIEGRPFYRTPDGHGVAVLDLFG